ncbi:MAG: cbb3-type cytochrome oxidase assembly protein [Planctomycetaceae bacterium]|nr:cbb3-type cytochrome oxidase assembly protein [Planctomycetaceae bacterium]
MTDPEQKTSEPKNQSRNSNQTVFIVTMVLAVLILIPSLLGFGLKFLELMHVLQGEDSGRFALTPIMNYLFASLGFLCLLIWATFQGMFRDIERPKESMLEIEQKLNERASH